MAKRKYRKKLLAVVFATFQLENSAASNQLRREDAKPTRNRQRKSNYEDQQEIEPKDISSDSESTMPFEQSDVERELFTFWTYVLKQQQSMSIQTDSPTSAPIASTSSPSELQTNVPTPIATPIPTNTPTAEPSAIATSVPTSVPSPLPSAITDVPTSSPTPLITSNPTSAPSPSPSATTDIPTSNPSPLATTNTPTLNPTAPPSALPSIPVTDAPSTSSPTTASTGNPSSIPTSIPTTIVPTTIEPTESPSTAPTQFQAILSYQEEVGVCAGSLEGIGCADDLGSMGNPNDILNCFDVSEFVGGPVPFFLDGVRFWIGESIPLPSDLSIRLWEGVPGTGPSMGEPPLLEQPLDSFGFGENTIELTTPLELTMTGICAGVFSESPNEGLRIRTEPAEGAGDNSFILAPNCNINDFLPLSELTGISQGYCIEAFVSFGG